MTERTDAHIYLGQLVDQALRVGKHRDALTYAISAYLIAREGNPDETIGGDEVLIFQACEKLLESNAKAAVEESRKRRQGQTVCSFCGKADPDVRLVAGPGVFICNECVAAATKALQQPAGKP